MLTAKRRNTHAPETTLIQERVWTSYLKALIIVYFTLRFFPLLAYILTGAPDEEVAFRGSTDNTLYQIFILFIFFNSIFLARVFRVPLWHVVLALLPAGAMLLWMGLSVAWSDYPSLTLRRTSREIIESTSIVLLALSLQGRGNILRIIFGIFFVINIADLVSFAMPSVSMTPIGFAGVHHHKNIAGIFFFFALPLFGIGLIDRSVARSPLSAAFSLCTAAGMLLITLSKTAIVCFFTSIGLMILTRLTLQSVPYIRVALFTMYAAFVFAVMFLISNIGISEFFDMAFDNPQLTGRSQIWQFTLSKLHAQPFTGVGYGAVWEVGPDLEAFLRYFGANWIANQAHNGYIDILAQLGYVGLALLILFFALTFRRLFKYTLFAERAQIFGLASYALYVFWGAVVSNITESSLFRTGHSMWFMLLFLSGCVSSRLFQIPAARPFVWLTSAQRGLIPTRRVVDSPRGLNEAAGGS